MCGVTGQGGRCVVGEQPAASLPADRLAVAWALHSGAVLAYAARRTTRHLADFHYLRQALATGREPDRLEEIKRLDRVF